MYTWLFYDYPYLVSLLFAVLLSLHLVTFLIFLLLVYVIFSSRHMPELRVITQQQKSVLTGSYTDSICWRMDDSSHCLKTGGIQRSKDSKSMDNTSFINSDIFVFMILIRTYLSLFQVVRLTTQCIHRFFDPMHYHHSHCQVSSGERMVGRMPERRECTFIVYYSHTATLL